MNFQPLNWIKCKLNSLYSLTIKKCSSEQTESTKKQDSNEAADENEDRGNWTGRFDFFLSCVGYAVGLGNVWRFPYLARDNGGGAFIIPYIIMLIIAGIPLFYLELSFGQFSNLGPLTIWRASPLFKGIGYSMLIVSFLVGLYYNVIIGWSFYYLFASMNKELPWKGCNNDHVDYRCREIAVVNGSKVNINSKLPPLDSLTPCNDASSTNCTWYQSAAEQYWEKIVLGMTTIEENNIGRALKLETDGLGSVQWHLALCLLLAWIVVFLCLIKGVKSSGKVVYFTALFPYAVLIILCINNALLDGSYNGVVYYLTPDWKKLGKAETWGKAATQIFYSLGVCFGGLITMASYNKFRNNCYRDAVIVTVLNCATSIFAGFIIFSALGYMSVRTGVPIDKVSKSGPALAFIVYPEGLSTMKVPQLWSVLFFFMLLMLGMDSQFGMVESIFSGLEDEYPNILKKTKWHQFAFKGIVCFIMYLLGLPMVCKGGIHIFNIFETYSGSFSLLIIALCEIIAICYVYGIKNFSRDIKMMIGKLPGKYWIGCWLLVTPIAILFILIFYLINFTRARIGDYTPSEPFQGIGYFILILSVGVIPVSFLYEGITRKWNFNPTQKWGPSIEKFWNEDPRYTLKLLENNQKSDDLKMKNGKKPEMDSNLASQVYRTSESNF